MRDRWGGLTADEELIARTFTFLRGPDGRIDVEASVAALDRMRQMPELAASPPSMSWALVSGWRSMLLVRRGLDADRARVRLHQSRVHRRIVERAVRQEEQGGGSCGR